MISDEEVQWQLKITDALNTYNPALNALKRKGYHLYFVPDPRSEFFGDFWAIKDKRVFIAMDPLRLLGLIGLWESMGDDWYQQHYEKIYDQVMDIGFAEDDFCSLDDKAFRDLVKDLTLLFEAMGENLPEPVTRIELARIIKAWSEEQPV